jgi:hypothetical protein
MVEIKLAKFDLRKSSQRISARWRAALRHEPLHLKGRSAIDTASMRNGQTLERCSHGDAQTPAATGLTERKRNTQKGPDIRPF